MLDYGCFLCCCSRNERREKGKKTADVFDNSFSARKRRRGRWTERKGKRNTLHAPGRADTGCRCSGTGTTTISPSLFLCSAIHVLILLHVQMYERDLPFCSGQPPSPSPPRRWLSACVLRVPNTSSRSAASICLSVPPAAGRRKEPASDANHGSGWCLLRSRCRASCLTTRASAGQRRS